MASSLRHRPAIFLGLALVAGVAFALVSSSESNAAQGPPGVVDVAETNLDESGAIRVSTQGVVTADTGATFTEPFQDVSDVSIVGSQEPLAEIAFDVPEGKYAKIEYLSLVVRVPFPTRVRATVETTGSEGIGPIEHEVRMESIGISDERDTILFSGPITAYAGPGAESIVVRITRDNVFGVDFLAEASVSGFLIDIP